MTAEQLLNALFNAGIAISVGATVLSLGMTYTIAQLLAPLKRVWLVIVVVIVNAVAIPAIAWLVAEARPIWPNALTSRSPSPLSSYSS